jgi:hypothetical protein
MSAIIKVLESLARTFTDHKHEFRVRKSGNNLYHIHGDIIYIGEPDFRIGEEEKLRIIVDALNHECEHINLGFSRERIENFIRRTRLGSLARWVLTIIEDHYTDFSRLKKWRGLKKPRTLFAKLVMEKEIPINHLCEREAALKGLYMISYSGYAKGEESISSGLRFFLDEARKNMLKVREMHNFEERERIAEEILNEITRMEPHNFMPFYDLDLKIDFQIDWRLTHGNYRKTEYSEYEDIAFDIDKILEWNGVDDLTPSEFEKTILESLSELEIEFEKQSEQIRGSIAGRDRRINLSEKPEVDESIVNELTILLEKIKNEDLFVESEWGEAVNIRNYLRHICGEKWRNLYYEIKPADTGGRAILIVLDLSGSMKEKIYETIKACHIVSQASEYLNDRIAAFGFQEKIGVGNQIIFSPIKFWHEKYMPEYYTGLDVFGSTPLREAVIEAGEWLKPVTAKEKVVFIFTDGEPTSSTPEQVFRAICRLGDLRVIGIGIGTEINPEMLQSCFGNSYLWVPNIRDMPNLLFSVYLSFMDYPVDFSIV